MTRFFRVALFANLIGGMSPPTFAETVAAHWDTYFYAAPTAGSRVLDEVQRKATLDLQGCKSGWCRVRYGKVDGYVREEVVHGPENAVPLQGPSTDDVCFTAAQPGGGAWQEETFCRSKR